jgi:hypothetical protein
MPLQPDPPFRPSEFRRVQELLVTIERASNALKDELVNLRARGDVKKKSWKEVFAEDAQDGDE